MTEIIPNLDRNENERDRLISDVAWTLARENQIPEIEAILDSCEKNISMATAYRWMPQIKAKYDELRKIIEEQEKMSLKLGIEASDRLADKFVTHDYGVIRDRLYNSTRGRFMKPGEVDLSKIVPDDKCPIPDPVDTEDDVREQIWIDMNNPRYDPNIDPDYEDKRRINIADLSGIDEVLSHFEKLRKADRNKIYNEFKNDFGPNFH
ncbi:MAG: hypothetical protein ACYDAP_03625 [Thermoplasmataceae archaeon]